MSGLLEITVRLAGGSLHDSPPAENATFGLLSVRVGDLLLTEAVSREREGAPQVLCEGPHVAGYPLAEWLVWNWWRLHWDGSVPPRRSADARRRWDFAHCMETVGDGYVWPKITVVPESDLTHLVSEASLVSDRDLFRYIGPAADEVVSARCFSDAVHRFVRQVLDALEGAGLHDTNLHRLWCDLEQEREDPKLARFRRAEALLGLDPDEVGEEDIWRCLADADALGESAWTELAAEAAYNGVGAAEVASAPHLRSLAESRGFVASQNDRIELRDLLPPKNLGAGSNGQGYIAFLAMPPWAVGAGMARRLRAREDLDGKPLDDEPLGGLAGLSPDVIKKTHRRGERLAYVLAEREGETRVVLRSGWRTGRRFELARLIGDRLLAEQSEYDDALFPATRAYTYRQKAQRAFAAELLSPFHAVEDLMAGDYSVDRQQEVARHFRVSEHTIRTQLVNHERIPREDAPDIAGRGLAAG